MVNKGLCMLLAILLCFFGAFLAPIPARAEELPETPPAEITEPASGDPSQVVVTLDYDQLVAAIREALTEETADAPAEEPVEEPAFWDKLLEDYTPTEGLLLVILVVLAFIGLLIWLR